MAALQEGEEQKDRKRESLYLSTEQDAMECEESGNDQMPGQATSSVSAHGSTSNDRMDGIGRNNSMNDQVGEGSHREESVASTRFKLYDLCDIDRTDERGETKTVLVDWTTNAEQHYNLEALRQSLNKTAKGIKNRKMLKCCALYACLNHEFDPHGCAPDADSLWNCRGCNEKVNATTSLRLWRLPDTLLIGLKRFTYCPVSRRLIKTCQWVKFPLEGLDLSKYCTSKEGDDPIYDLYGVCYNSGSTPESGHCTSSVKCHDGKWRSFNDSWVKVIDEGDVVADGACLLFYRKRNLQSPSQREILELMLRDLKQEEQAVKYCDSILKAATPSGDAIDETIRRDVHESHQLDGHGSHEYFREQRYESVEAGNVHRSDVFYATEKGEVVMTTSWAKQNDEHQVNAWYQESDPMLESAVGLSLDSERTGIPATDTVQMHAPFERDMYDSFQHDSRTS